MEIVGNELQEMLQQVVSRQREENEQNLELHSSFDHAKWASLHAELNNNGTNNSKNLTDPFGDGDQSLIHNEKFAQFHRGDTTIFCLRTEKSVLINIQL
jgi:hypothetical protein